MADGSIGNDSRSTAMIGVPLAIDRDGSYVVAVVAESEAVGEVEAAVEVEEEEAFNNETTMERRMDPSDTTIGRSIHPTPSTCHH